MSNYEDWDPEWRPVGDPVPIDDDSNECDWGEQGTTEEQAPSEASRPGIAFADIEAFTRDNLAGRRDEVRAIWCSGLA